MTELEVARAELSARAVRAIVIGGSAGGVDALRILLPALPATLAVPVLVVLHISPDSRSVWSVLFERCSVQVAEPDDKDRAQPGCVYFAPPNYHLLVDQAGCLQLSVDERVHFARPSIDVLFESAAWAYGQRLLGVVLSGANADGAAGLAAIAAAGGLCWVQAPETAPAPMMPRSALNAVPGARRLTLEQMSELFSGEALGSRSTAGGAGLGGGVER